MRGFEENNCRLCEKAFCCQKCRLKHEVDVHKVVPECDLCIYGQFVFDNLGDAYLQHLKASHLPLNCIYCKRIFSNVEDIILHKKCPILHHKDDSPKTPFKQVPSGILVSVDDQEDSPILLELQRKEALNYIFNLATSTPMQRGKEPMMFEKSKDPITPVDKNSLGMNNKSIIKKVAESVKGDNSSKRRVTFGEIPANNALNRSVVVSAEKKIIYVKDAPEFSDTNTPVTGMSTGTFFSAKSEAEQFHSAKTEVTSKSDRESTIEVTVPEGSTPVSAPNPNNYRSLNLVPNENESTKTNAGTESFKNKENKSLDSDLSEVSMDICSPSPARLPKPVIQLTISDNSVSEPDEKSSDFSSETASSTDQSKTPNIHFSTPGNPGKMLVKGAMYKNSEATNDQFATPAAKAVLEQEDDSDKENNSEIHANNKEIGNATGCKTLWLSAINLEDSHDSKEPEKSEAKLDSPSPKSPCKPSRPRVSIVMPTPILKRTDVKMKFQFPAHFSSTPIMSSGVVKMKQTKIVEELSTRVLRQQTPFKQPHQEKFTGDHTEHSFIESNDIKNTDTFSDIAAGPSSTRNKLVVLSENYSFSETSPCRDVTRYHSNIDSQEISTSPVTGGVSVSSMTESTLWTSMTRYVKSVLGLSNSQDSNISDNMISTTSFKRQLSDPEASGDFLEAPRLKRFKFTDIKCRRPIRDSKALELPSRMHPPASSRAEGPTFEIMKSVTTLYGTQKMRVLYDKATQTDDYLMYGWHAQT